MWKWVSDFFKRPTPVIDGEAYKGFKIGRYDVLVKRSTIPGRKPENLLERELAYSIPDDKFFVGTGNGKFKEYVLKK